MTFFTHPSGPSVHIEFTFSEGTCIETRLTLAKTFEASLKGTLKNKDKLIQWLTNYAMGKKHNPFPLPMAEEYLATFHKKVLKALVAIPFGDAAAYSDVAATVGSPRAPRAVGQACGRNPFPLIVPCHRVLQKGGALGGFSMGLEIKRVLLSFEKIPYIE